MNIKAGNPKKQVSERSCLLNKKDKYRTAVFPRNNYDINNYDKPKYHSFMRKRQRKSLPCRDTPDAIRQRGAIFQFLKVDKIANERRF